MSKVLAEGSQLETIPMCATFNGAGSRRELCKYFYKNIMNLVAVFCSLILIKILLSSHLVYISFYELVPLSSAISNLHWLLLLINVIIIFQLKYIEEGDFKDLKHLIKLHLDGNQFSVIVGNLFSTQKSLEYLGKLHIIFSTV